MHDVRSSSKMFYYLHSSKLIYFATTRSYAMSRPKAGFGRQPHSGSCAMCRVAYRLEKTFFCRNAQSSQSCALWRRNGAEPRDATFRHNVRLYAMFCTDLSDNYFQFSRFVYRIEGFGLSPFRGAKYGCKKFDIP